ncbi:MAG: class I SAM-dependent methyltransferase [Planctomycetota bacterium]
MEPAEYGAMAAVEERHWWFRGRLTTVRAFLRRHARRGLGLDVSSGTGMTLGSLGDWVQCGADISPLALGFCRARGLTRLAQGDLARLPFADGGFDALTCLDTLEHVQDDVAALAEIHRVLRPGGVALMTVPAHPWMFSAHDAALHHVRRYRRRELIERVRASGLELVQLRYTNVAIFPLVAALRLVRRGASTPKSDTANVPAAPMNALLYALTAVEGRVLPTCRARSASASSASRASPRADSRRHARFTHADPRTEPPTPDPATCCSLDWARVGSDHRTRP